MSHLICEKCGNDMGEFRGEVMKIENCPKCGSDKLTRMLILCDKIEIHENVKGKSNKMPGKKKPYSEMQAGEEWSASRQKFVDKTRQIDRENNHYYEKVTDRQTGEVLHECSEPLDQHFGHGSDKKKKE